MGSTGYYGLTAEQAKEAEMRGMEILARHGSWWIVKSAADNSPILIKFIVRRYGAEVNVKTMSIDMGPYGRLPASVAKKYLAMHDGDIESAGRSAYGVEILRKALEAPKAPKLAKGDRFTIRGVLHAWSDGAPVDGVYTYLGGFHARRSDGIMVGLPKAWRTRWAWEAAS